MSDQQQSDVALEAVRTAIEDATDALLVILKDERETTAADARPPVTSGLRLAYALGRMADDQREALRIGAAFSEHERQLLAGLLTTVVTPAQEP